VRRPLNPPYEVHCFVLSYQNIADDRAHSSEFRSLRPSSQAIYRGLIDRFSVQYGDNRVANLKHEHVVKLMAARAEKPVAANNLRKVAGRAAAAYRQRADEARHSSCPCGQLFQLVLVPLVETIFAGNLSRLD
jgi:hypothetical protein